MSGMSPLGASLVLGLVLVLGMVLSRRAQQGYIDFLTPLLAVYFLHYVTRGLFIVYGIELLSFPLNPQVAAAGDQEIAEALLLTAAAVALLILSYLVVTRFAPVTEAAVSELERPSMRLVMDLLVLGLACRGILRLADESIISLPDWASTPIDTFGWAVLGGLFLAGFRWGQPTGTAEQNRGATVAIVGGVMCIVVDGRLTASREAVLQPILAVMAGVMIGRGASPLRIAQVAVILVVPIFLWIGAMKIYHSYELGPGAGYVESISAVRDYRGLDWLQSTIGTFQDRFHGLDSLIVCRAVVPSRRPFEEGSVWTQVLLSAFVPRLIYSGKHVGWGTRFAVEFWGADPRTEGSFAVGISHLGEFYVYAGDVGCLTGMVVLGAALGGLAHYLRRRRDAFGLLMFALLALTVCQVDRDLDVALGGMLKLLLIFSGLLFMRRTRLNMRRGQDRPLLPTSRRPSARAVSLR